LFSGGLVVDIIFWGFMGFMAIVAVFAFWDHAEKKKEDGTRTDILKAFSGGDSEVFCGNSSMHGVAVGQKITLMMSLQTLEMEPSEIDSAEVVISSPSSIQKTNRGSQVGRAVVGGVLLGPLGAAAGAVTATRTQTQLIDSIAVRVVANNHVYDVPFYQGIPRPESEISSHVFEAQRALRAIQRRRLGGGWGTYDKSIEEAPASPGSSSPMY
jgi:hypothetical protein